MLVIRLICAAYWLLLTLLLLVPDPMALLGIERIPSAAKAMGVHLMCFAVLGVLVLGSRLPIRRVPLAGLLIGYAIAAELLQALVPLRTVDLSDFIENLLGLGAGTAIWWIRQKRVFQRPKDTG